MEQASLDWGEKLALDLKKHRSLDVRLHVYCCINYNSVVVLPNEEIEKVEQATIKRVDEWVQRLIMHTRVLGIPVEREVEWDEDWRKAIVEAAKRRKSDIVIKNLTQHARLVRWVRNTSDWQLLRDCDCPVVLVKTGRSYRINKILVAVKHTDDEKYTGANVNIVDHARRLADDFGASLHAVTCYERYYRPHSRALVRTYPDRQRFADSIGLERSQVSAAIGEPAKVIASVADEGEADLLIIARVARPESANILGDTARKVIDEIDTDVLVLPMES
jgi:universal stress protein E